MIAFQHDRRIQWLWPRSGSVDYYAAAVFLRRPARARASTRTSWFILDRPAISRSVACWSSCVLLNVPSSRLSVPPLRACVVAFLGWVVLGVVFFADFPVRLRAGF